MHTGTLLGVWFLTRTVQSSVLQQMWARMANVEKDDQFYMTLVTIRVSTSPSILFFAHYDDPGGELSLQSASANIEVPVQGLLRYVFSPCVCRCRGVKR